MTDDSMAYSIGGAGVASSLMQCHRLDSTVEKKIGGGTAMRLLCLSLWVWFDGAGFLHWMLMEGK